MKDSRGTHTLEGGGVFLENFQNAIIHEYITKIMGYQGSNELEGNNLLLNYSRSNITI